MMNEVLSRRYVKKVMKQGISKYMAKEIVNTAIDACKERTDLIDLYIDYAILLEYGMNFKKKLDA